MNVLLDKVDDYRNATGELFSIFVQEIPVKDPTQLWGFRFVVIDSRSLVKQFTVAIRRAMANNASDARSFALGAPLTFLKELLDITHNGTTPLVYPQNGNWLVCP